MNGRWGMGSKYVRLFGQVRTTDTRIGFGINAFSFFSRRSKRDKMELRMALFQFFDTLRQIAFGLLTTDSS